MADLKWKCSWCGLEFESDWYKFAEPVKLGEITIDGVPPNCPNQDNKDTHPFSVAFSRVDLIKE